MNVNRMTAFVLVVISSFLLAGAKKPLKKHGHLQRSAKITQADEKKSLNLAIPAVVEEIVPEQTIQASASESLLDLEKKPKDKTVGLRGQVILSQEPEAGKLKSADGAGIVFDFHH